MIVKIYGNLSDGNKEYSNGFHYEETDDFIKRNAQNCLPFSKMSPEEKVMAQKADKKKPFIVNTPSFDSVKKNKMLTPDAGPVKTKVKTK